MATVRDSSARYYLDDLAAELARVDPGARGAPLAAGSGPRRTRSGSPGRSRPTSSTRSLGRATRRPAAARSRARGVGGRLRPDLLGAQVGERPAGAGPPRGRRRGARPTPRGGATAASLTSSGAPLAVRRGSGEERAILGADGLAARASPTGSAGRATPTCTPTSSRPTSATATDGRWSAIDGRGLFAHARAAGALYDAHLRPAIAPIGGRLVAFARPRRVGARRRRPRAARPPFPAGAPRSARRRPATGGGSPGARHVAWAATRGPKADRPRPRAVSRLVAARAAGGRPALSGAARSRGTPSGSTSTASPPSSRPARRRA